MDELPQGPGGMPPKRRLTLLEYNRMRPKNTLGQVIGRMAVGGVIGVAGCVFGEILMRATEIPGMFFVPLGGALVLAAVYAVRQRKYGYFTGIILGPVILMMGVVLLLFIICGVMR